MTFLQNLILSLSLSFCIFHFVNSQSDDTTSRSNFSYALRGKVIGGFIIEDIYFGTYTLGNEIIFKDRHSLGVDFTWFRWRFENDNDVDLAMYEEYEKRTYLYADYKLKILKIRDKQLYFNLYDKIGNYKMWYKALDYDFNYDTSFFRSKTNGKFNELGLGLGLKLFFGDADSGFGLDLNANVAKRFSSNDILDINQGVTTFTEDERTEKILFFMRLNLFYKFRNRSN